jgi:hypothetical protein
MAAGGLNRLKPAVAVHTASLTFTNYTFCPHSVFMFCVDLSSDKIEKNEMGGACSAVGGGERRV